MKRLAQIILLLLMGAALLHISLFTQLYLRYVKEGLQPLLIVTGLVLVALGLVGAWRDGLAPAPQAPASPSTGPRATATHSAGTAALERADQDGTTRDGAAQEEKAQNSPAPAAGHQGGDEGHEHDHSTVPRVAWLLFLPAFALLLYAPPALGSFTASRESDKPPQAVRKADDQMVFADLPAADPVPLTLTDFSLRSQRDRGQSLRGRTVQLTGFVTPGSSGTWYVTRLIISCCAADSQSIKVKVHGTEAPPADTWVAVTGNWHAQGALGTASASTAVDAVEVRTIKEPPSPYTDTVPPPRT